MKVSTQLSTKTPNNKRKPQSKPKPSKPSKSLYEEDTSDPFFKYSKHLAQETLKTYDLLEVESKTKSYMSVCKLNDSRVDKRVLLRKILKFAEASFRLAVKRESSESYMKGNCALLDRIIDMIKTAVYFNDVHKWYFNTGFSSTAVKLLVEYMKDEFLLRPKIISTEDLLDRQIILTLSFGATDGDIIRLVDTLAFLLNYKCFVMLKNGEKNKTILINTIYQALMVKKLVLNNHFDVLCLVHYLLNLQTLFEKAGMLDEAIRVGNSSMMTLEILQDHFRVDSSTTISHASFFFENFRFLDGNVLDKELEEKYVKFDNVCGEQELRNLLQQIIKLRLCTMYDKLGKVLHEKGQYQEAYLAMNYHNNLYVDLIGENNHEVYSKVLKRIGVNRAQHVADTNKEVTLEKGYKEKTEDGNPDDSPDFEVVTGKKEKKIRQEEWKASKKRKANDEGYEIGLFKKYNLVTLANLAGSCLLTT